MPLRHHLIHADGQPTLSRFAAKELDPLWRRHDAVSETACFADPRDGWRLRRALNLSATLASPSIAAPMPDRAPSRKPRVPFTIDLSARELLGRLAAGAFSLLPIARASHAARHSSKLRPPGPRRLASRQRPSAKALPTHSAGLRMVGVSPTGLPSHQTRAAQCGCSRRGDPSE
jgi:hypothetical protein